MSCLICQYVEDSGFRLVHEFPLSILTVGEHQFYTGYCVLLLKEHVRDLHEMPADLRSLFFEELMLATEAIVKAFAPAKMNHASYGNAQPHLHWHIFPRYADDPDRETSPWTHQDRFSDFTTTPEMADQVRQRLLPHL